ncbi:MAG TPA: dihydrofolate reductase family protein [Puia sp.]|jgi:dihydrofolate reductase
MRDLIYAINLTLDGVCDHTTGVPDDEIMDFYTNLLGDADTFVYGRKTYQLMVPYWPDVAKNPANETKADVDYANAFEAMKKIIVVSRSLEKVEGKNTSIVRSDLEGEIRKLKQEPGKNILTGGVDLPGQLTQLGLIDEYLFTYNPFVVGKGRRLWDDVSLPASLKLKLVGSKFFKSGTVALRYRKS